MAAKDLQLEAEKYEELYGSFLRDHKAKLQGKLVFLEALKGEFEAWEASSGSERVPFLCDQFMKVCHDYGAALSADSSAVRFLAEGESTIDAAMWFKWRVKEQGPT